MAKVDIGVPEAAAAVRRRQDWKTAATGILACCLLLALTGCVRRRETGDVSVFFYKWWVWVASLLPLGLTALMCAKYPTTWIDGVWRPWWKFRGWHLQDAIYAVGGIALFLVEPFQLPNRVEVGRDYFREENGLGLRASRQIDWPELSRIDVKSEKPAGDWAPDMDREHGKKPDMVAVFKDGRTEVFRGALVIEARDAILKRARAAGVPVVTTDDPGAAGAAAGPPAAAPGVDRPGERPPAGFAFPPGRQPRRPRGGLP